MPKQTAISKVNEQYLKDRENGYTREHYSSMDTAQQMLEEYEQEQREKEERRRKAAEEEYQRQYSQFQSSQNADLADWIRGMSPTALADDAQQRRLETAKGIYTSDTGEKKTGSGRSLKKRAEDYYTPSPQPQPANRLTPDLEAAHQRAASSGPYTAPNAYQTAMMQRDLEAQQKKDASGWKSAGYTAAGMGANFLSGAGNPIVNIARMMEMPDDLLYAITKDERFNLDREPGLRDSEALKASDDFAATAQEMRGKVGSLGQKLIDTAGAAGNMMGSFALFGGAAGAAGNPVDATARLANLGGGKIGSALGQAGAKIGMELLSNPGNFGISLGSAVGSYSDALKDGAGFGKAVANGLLKGATEYYSNKLFSGTPFEDSADKGYVTKLIEYAADKIGGSKILQAINATTGGRAANWIFDKAGEGLEEVVTRVMDPMIDRITYKKDVDYATVDDLTDEFFGGVLLSLLMSGGEALISGLENPDRITEREVEQKLKAAGIDAPTARQFSPELAKAVTALMTDAQNRSADYAEKSAGNAETAAKGAGSDSETMQRYAAVYNRGEGASQIRQGANPQRVNQAAFLTDAEAGNYFYIWNQQGPKAADAFYQMYLAPELEQRRLQATREYIRQDAIMNAEQRAMAEQYAEARSALGISDSFANTPPVAEERTTPPLPRQAAQEQQERATTPPLPQNAQNEAQERTTPHVPQQMAQEQEKQAPTPPVPQSVQNAQETAQEDLSTTSWSPSPEGEARTEERTAAPEGEARKQTKAQQTVATQRKRAMADSTAVSLQSRGFTEAGAQETAFIREETQMDAEERAVTEALRAEGLEPTLFTGLVTDAEGKKVSILQDGNRVALQADNRSRSLTSLAEQVLGHPITTQQTSDLSTAARSPSPEGEARTENAAEMASAGEARSATGNQSAAPAEESQKPPVPRSQTAGLRTRENPKAQAARESALQAGASEETANQVARLAKILNKDIRCVNEPERNGAVKNGWTQDGVIYYNVAGNERPLAWVVGHELTHNTEHAKTYEKLAALTKRVYGKQWDAAVRQLMAERAEVARRLGDSNVEIDRNETEREIVANFFADNLLTNEDMIREVVENDAPTARRILNYLKDLLRKWQGKEPTIERAIDLYSKALKEVAAGAQEKGAARGGLTVGTPARSAQDIKNRKYSVQSIFNAAGFQVTMKGGRVIATDGNGKYRDQQTMNVTELSGSISEENAGMLSPEYGREFWGENAQTPDTGVAARAAERYLERNAEKPQFSAELRKDVVNRLDKQVKDGNYVIVYHSMYRDKDGNLYSPMAGKKKVGNQWVLTNPYNLNTWYKSDAPENIADLIENGSVKLKDNGQWSFNLKKPDKSGDVPAALNPWNHASTDALNDQFTSAYERENDEGELVTVECIIPLSEVDQSVAVDPETGKVETKPYEEKGMVTDRDVMAKPDSQNKKLKQPTLIAKGTTINPKDSVGLKMWKAGPVHGQISGKRPVYLSRWIRNTRVLSTEETAKMIAQTLKKEGFTGEIPGNVVGMKLRKALEAEGVKFGKPQSGVAKGYYAYMEEHGYSRAQADGEPLGSGRSYSAELKEEEKPTSFEYMKPFAEQLKDFMDKKNRGETFGKDALLIGTTPQVFQDIGLISLPVAINQSHVKYVTDQNYAGKEEFKAGHTFDIDEFAKLPEKLADPVAIIADQSKQDLVVYVEMKNESGTQTIVPFRVDTKTKLGGRSVDVQLAKSVYGGEDADSILAAAIGKDSEDSIRVYYVNKSKIPPKISAAVREYGRTVPDGIIHTINEPGAPVKGQKKSKLETSQFKNWFKGSKVVDSEGNPKIVYHQTAARFWTFNTDNPVAAKNDSETPNGIFFKDNDHDIGIGGDRQMAVYLAMRKPLQFKNREAANKWYQKHIDGYAQLQDQMKAALSPFDAELNEIENEMFAEGTTDEQYEELNKKWDAKLDQMREVEDKYRGQLRELLNDYFLKNDSGFDGIILDYDGHRYVDGKRENVKTYIVFKNTQIKSATDNIGLYDPKNPDIRYSAELTDRERSTEALEGRLLGSRELLGTPALKKLGVKVSGSVGRYANTEQLMAKNKAAKQLKKAAADAERRLQATEAEKDFASGIAAMVYDEEDIPARLRRDVVMELADYYFASDSANLDTLAKIRADINAGLRAEAGDLLEEADFKPQSMLKLNERTPERNFRAMFGERGDEITEWLVQPVRENEAEKIRWFNAQLDKVREFEDSKGKKRELTRQESALTMKYMEGTAAAQMIADLETDPKNRYGKQTAKNIKNAATNIRNGESAADAAKEFSLGDREKDLAAKYAAWQNTLEELKESDSTIVENAAKAYAELFDQYYEAINDFLVAHGYEPIGYIKGYAPHMQPEATQTMLEKALGALGVNAEVKELPASIAGQTAIYKPNKRWNPYFLQRTGSTAEYDIVKAFESYVDYMADIFYHTDDIMRARQMVRWIRQSFAPEEIRSKLDYIDTIRQAPTEVKTNLLRDAGEIGKTTVMSPMDTEAAMQEYVDKLFEQAKNTSKYSNLVMWLENYANILAGKQSFADRGWEYSTGRKSLNTFNRLNNAFQKSNVAGNLSSVINQTAQLPMIAAELGERDFLGGLVDVVTGKAKNWVQDSDFLTEKEGKDYLYADNADKFIDALYKPASWMDHLVSTVAVRGAFDKAIRQGKNYAEAMRYADDFGRKLMGSRAKGSRPLAYESKGAFSKMVHMFQVECANSWDHIASDLPYEIKQIAKTQGKGKAARTLAALIIRALLGAFLLNRTAEELYGGTPAPFDILGLAANFVASGQGLTTNRWIKKIIDNGMEKLGGERIFGTKATEGSDEFSVTTAGEELLYNVMNDLPLARNVAGVFGLGDQTVPLPGASGEFKDVVTAISKLLDDGVDEGELADLLRATLKAASQFAPGGRQIRKTAEGAEAVIRGGSYKSGKLQYPVNGAADKARALVFGKNATQAARDFWAAGGKALSEKQTGVYQGLVDEGMSQQEAYDTITGYRDEGNLNDYVKWTDSRSRDAGVDEGTYLKFREDTKGITGDPDGKGSTVSGTKKAKIVRYIDGLDLTPEQKTAMLLDYDSGYSLKEVTWSGGEKATKPASEPLSAKGQGYYDGFVAAGIGNDKAEDLARKLESSDAGGHAQWRIVYDAAGSEGEKAVVSLMNDGAKRNWDLAKNAGVSMDDYITVRENYLDLNENGKESQDEWNATLDSFTFSTNSAKDKSIKGTLWQILTGSKSTKNNPYDREAGQKVIDAKSGGGSGSGSYAMARLVTQRTPEAPRAAKPRGGLVATGRPYTAGTGGLVLKKK